MRSFLAERRQHHLAGCQGNLGQSTHHRLDRLQIVSVGSLRDPSTTLLHRWRSTAQTSGQGFDRVRSPRSSRKNALIDYFGNSLVKAHHTFICACPNDILVKPSQAIVIFQQKEENRREFSSCGIVDTETIKFVFLLILLCWRVFFLGSPALHYAGTDRLQMVGVRSLHFDRPWFLVSSSSVSRQT